MRVFITGGKGFIGRVVGKALVEHGHEVVSYDVSRSHNQGEVDERFGSIMAKDELVKNMKGCDVVLHLAAVLGVLKADIELLHCMNINIMGTVNVLEAAVIRQVPHVIIASSSEIFGDICNGPLDEESPFNPKSGYAVSKLANEHYIKGFHTEFGIDYNIVRFFNVYGVGQKPNFVAPKFVDMVRNNTPPTIYGDGGQIRCFCHAADAAQGLIRLIESTDCRNDTFNIGNDEEPVNMKELASKIIRIAGKDFEPIFVPFEKSDRTHQREIHYRRPNIEKARTRLGYAPTISLDEGLRRMIDGKE